MANRWGSNGNSDRLFWGAPKSLQMVTAAMKLKDTWSWKKSYGQPTQHIIKQRYYFANKGLSSKSYGFSSSYICSLLDFKEIKPVHPKGNQSWIFTGRTDAEAKTPILWPPDGKNWLTGKDPGAGKDWRQEEKGVTEDEMVGWHQWFGGHEFERVLGVGDEEESLMCYSPWGHKESDTGLYSPWGCKELDTTERLSLCL